MELFYASEGRGRPLLLTHGWTMSHRVFDRQKALRDRFQVICWDLPGHGESKQRPEGYSISDCAVGLRELLQRLGLHEVIGLGWSMGATVLWEYLRQFGAEPFQSMVNVESVPWGVPEHFQVWAVAQSFQKDRPRAARKFIRQMFYKEPAAETLDWVVAESLKTPMNTALRYYSEIAGCDYRQVFRDTPLPVLSMMSRRGFYSDQVLEMVELHAQQVEWFEESGHMPFWEESEKFNQILRTQL